MNSHVSYNTFTQKIYNQVSIENDQNLVISPISLFMSLLICYAGSKGKSYNQLGKLLDISRQLDHQTFSYNHNFLSYTQQFSAQNLKLSLANRVYLQNGFKIEQNFLHTVNSMFTGSLQQLDFSNSQKSAKAINDWVASRTNNKIKQAINPDSLSAATRLVLVNAIYFKANWALLFDEETTFKEDFFVSDGSKVKVPMMRIYDEYFKHLFKPANIDASTIEIPFSDRNFAMTIILPDQRFSLSHVERQLNAANVQKIISLNMIKEPMNIFIPKFSISSDLDVIFFLNLEFFFVSFIFKVEKNCGKIGCRELVRPFG